MKRKYISLVLVIGGAIAVFFGLLMLYNEGGTTMISNAKELKINASEIGVGVEEIKSSYISDPADFYVFNDTTGAKKFFDYMKEEMNGTSVSGLGEEAAYSEQMSGWLVRTSNAVLLVGFTGMRGEFDGKDAGRIIAGKIIEKVSHK